ncbi:MAG: hypothetical protein R6V58_07965 [Planctomycetota bacterium]
MAERFEGEIDDLYQKWISSPSAVVGARLADRLRQEVIIMDEAEQLDSRRSMSNKNVEFWNLWQTMRFRQITSILTLPTRSALDKRGMELAGTRQRPRTRTARSSSSTTT